jgi:membrane protein YqaA with SNARE-associated domain
MHWKRIDSIFVIFLGIMISLSLIFAIHPDYAMIVQFSTYHQYLAPFAMASLIVLLVCFLGNVIPLPTPYLLITWIASTLYRPDNSWIPLYFALIASLGAVTGEIVSYWIGRGARHIISIEKYAQIQFFQKILAAKPTFAPILLYLFGLTPISDDVILIPLGLLQYPQKKIFIYCGLGKFSLMLILALLPDLIFLSDTNYSFLTTMGPLFAIVILMYFLLRIDWVEIIRKSPWIIQIFKLGDILNDSSIDE